MAEIETAYYNMALSAGINMEGCRLFPVEGINHFLTRRFDRIATKKVQTPAEASIQKRLAEFGNLSELRFVEYLDATPVNEDEFLSHEGCQRTDRVGGGHV